MNCWNLIGQKVASFTKMLATCQKTRVYLLWCYLEKRRSGTISKAKFSILILTDFREEIIGTSVRYFLKLPNTSKVFFQKKYWLSVPVLPITSTSKLPVSVLKVWSKCYRIFFYHSNHIIEYFLFSYFIIYSFIF